MYRTESRAYFVLLDKFLNTPIASMSAQVN